MVSERQLIREQAQANRDDFINSIADYILQRRRKGAKTNVFPKYLYVNTRVFEDWIGPVLTETNEDGSHRYLWEDMGIEVRHSPIIPTDRFSLGHLEHDPHAVGKHLRHYPALPAKA